MSLLQRINRAAETLETNFGYSVLSAGAAVGGLTGMTWLASHSGRMSNAPDYQQFACYLTSTVIGGFLPILMKTGVDYIREVK